MDKKTMLITGGASGIGLETAKLFLRKGYFVGIIDLNVDPIADFCKEQGEDSIIALKADVSNYDDVKKAVDAFAAKTNNVIDVLCSNAGILFVGNFESLDHKKVELMTKVNTLGGFYLAQAALPYLKNSKQASIVFTSSASGIVGLPSYSAYGATKAFTTSLAECLNLELEEFNIHVAAVKPVIVKTAMTAGDLGNYEEGSKPKQETIKLIPQDVANVIWKASQDRKKLYWFVGKEATVLDVLIKFVPFGVRRRIIKKLVDDTNK